MDINYELYKVSVSYTHLDVYKRQPMQLGIYQWLLYWRGTLLGNFKAMDRL